MVSQLVNKFHAFYGTQEVCKSLLQEMIPKHKNIKFVLWLKTVLQILEPKPMKHKSKWGDMTKHRI
jgi:hypothetical protein